MKKIVAYKVIEANGNGGTCGLEAEVNQAIVAGWQPNGPLVSSVMGEGSQLFYAQPMVKWEDQ